MRLFFEKLIECAERLRELKELELVYWKHRSYLFSNALYHFKDETLKQEMENFLGTIEEKNRASLVEDESKLVSELCEQADVLIDKFERKVEELRPYIYFEIRVDSQPYKVKTVLYDIDDGTRILRYMIMSFYSKQEMRAFMSNLQKGGKRHRLNGHWEYYESIRNGYIGIEQRTLDLNNGDGVHAIIWHDSERVIRVHDNNVVDAVYNWMKANLQTGLIPEWKEYFYNTLKDKGLIRVCEGFDLTNKAPKVVVIDNKVDTELVRSIKQEGLKSNEIELPVEEDVQVEDNISFLEILKRFVIDTIKNEKAHYNVGEPISQIFKSQIRFKTGATSRLFPRQQIIGQGLVNAMKAGKASLFFNGGMGTGKTFISIKSSYAILEDVLGRKDGRIIVYAQGHILPKWERQFEEALKPIGINPKFYTIKSFKDVKDLPQKPNGIEVYLMPKDRVKRNYQVTFASRHRFNTNNLEKINNYINNVVVNKDEKYIIEVVENLPLNQLKVAARWLEEEHRVPVVLLKEQLDDNGNVVGYKGVTTFKALLSKLDNIGKAYQFYIKSINDIKEAMDEVIDEFTPKLWGISHFQNGLTCPTCGGFVYDSSKMLFDEEDYMNNLYIKPNGKSQRNNKCNHYVKVDGTPLTNWEIEEIRKGNIDTVIVTEKVTSLYVPYLDNDGNPLEGKDLQQAKAGNYQGCYKIALKICGTKMWSAYDQVGYRTVNAAEMMLKRFGKNSFDLLIADECHIFAKESEQGLTFGTLCRLSKYILGLTGTLTGGKASDLYYMFWRMMPQRMVELGYKYEDVSIFIDHFGRKKRVTREYIKNAIYNKSGKGKKSVGSWSEIAGISPFLYTYFLADTMVSRTLEDMDIPMPKLRFFKHEIEMSKELAKAYQKLKDDLLEFMREHKELRLGGTYLHALLAYPDMPQAEPLYYKSTDLLVANPTYIDLKGKILPKEQKLLDTIKRERAEDRKVAVYANYSGTKGVTKRLVQIISEAGFKCKELTSKVPLEKREEWIEKEDKKGTEVIVLNPKLCETGLDIVQFPTIYFFEIDYDAKLVRQAEKRPWRPNQTKECRIYYSFYKGTLQEDAVKIVGSKKKASLALEGVFSEDMLSSMGDGGIDSGAEILFKALQGKITLKESELDSIGFEDEEELCFNVKEPEPEVPENLFDWAEKNKEDTSEAKIKIITITDIDEIKKRKMPKKERDKVVEGQLVMFG